MKKKNYTAIANIVIIILIVVVFAGIQFNEFSFYKETARNQAQNDVGLTSIDIKSRITSISSEQRVASQMMANDIFLKEWCNKETSDVNSEHAKQLYGYLNEYKEKYNYDVVFFVSNKTYNYYYDGGLNKVISKDDDFDIWYFNFLDLNQEYDIQIDHDEVNDFSVTLFVNCLVLNEAGDIAGVVGVGQKIDDFESSVNEIIESFDINVCIVNTGNAHNSFTGSSGVYKTAEDAANELGISKEDVLMDVGSNGHVWTNGNKITSVQKNEDLKWNIIVQKDISDEISELLKRSYMRVTFLIIIIVLYILVSFTFLKKIRDLNSIAENTDEFTGLFNNKLFKERFDKRHNAKLKKHVKETAGSLFILDVDDFKSFNDTFGHLYGNTVLKTMANELKDSVGDDGELCRWGGDEFVGEIYEEPEIALSILNGALENLKHKDTKMPITFSCGICKIDSRLSLADNLKMADKALYKSKEKGKKCCTIWERNGNE
ncbi:sensor domain-containing diguanylate cyclase [Butyrivibrio sp. FC2001]|uniref:sensor domain-containing diguanylate cyclase n=1 Tax=Butyrivibrio sp. FC2001 TaxID=1280671 RepID=UPI000411A253|nr:sensor domain-containing diguanylate cyclase [Butyrivibrio sp. FC2001]